MLRTSTQHDRRHHLIAHLLVGHGVYGDLVDLRQALQDPLDRSGREVLAVHPHPVGGSPGQIDPAVGVAVGQIARPVHSVSHPLGGGVGIVVVTGEPAHTVGVDQFADGFVEIGERAVLIENRCRTFGHGLRVVHADTRITLADRAGRRPVLPHHHDGELAGPEAVHHPAAETSCEFLDITLGGLVAERRAQGVVGVVGTFRGRQQQRQRLADIVHVRHAIPADVGQKPRRRKLGRHHRGTAVDRHRPPRRDAVGVKQRHRQVTHVVAGDLEPVDQARAAQDRHRVGEAHRLRVTAGARREDHRHGIDACDVAGNQRSRGRHRVAVTVALDIQDRCTAQVEPVEQRLVFGVDQHDLAVGATDVGGQAPAAAGGVDPAQHVSAECGARHRPQHGRGITQQRADVRRPGGVEKGRQNGRLGRRLVQVLTPGPGPVAVQHRDRVVGHA